MTPKVQRTTPCGPHERKSRMVVAEGFWADAEDLTALGTGHGNSVVTLYVHAGIAAADIICCARLGRYSSSGNHADALLLLQQAAPELKPSLQRLVSVKSSAGYGVESMSAKKITEARAAADKLMTAARMV